MNILTKSDQAQTARNRNVTAILGPTNTGKTHLAIERMLAHPTGIIGLPLRLLAREVYARIVARTGVDSVALITGEEKIIPSRPPRFRVCTVEALPDTTDASFLAIDEIQLAADLERGHVFTDRILNLRGRDETLLLGAATMRRVIEKLVPGVNVVTRPRLSVLFYNGSKKITRLPHRSAVVAFSASEVYAIGELIRRQRGGVAVVLGALSPRTRNAQVELFQSGDVDFLVATDAIGMGLNLDVEHVAFAADRKYDGYQYRRLTPSEFAQVAGRAGRHTRDGTFGVTGRVDPLEPELVEALESHRFDAVKTVQWRNRQLDFSTLASLSATLDLAPTGEGLVKALPAEDMKVLELARRESDVLALADRRSRIALLWDACQIPDYRRIALANHAELAMTVFSQIAKTGVISEDWFADQVAFADRTDGDIDTLANRIAHIRTWTYAANRPHWLSDQAHWQERTRAIEDRLSDALHERLTQRFVDRRTSVLMRRLRENTMPEAEIKPDGEVVVEGLHVGVLQGFRFVPDPQAGGSDAKALRAAAQQALAGEIARRAEGVAAAGNEQFVLASDGFLRWQGVAVGRLVDGDEILRPRLILLADESLTGPTKDAVQARIDLWLKQHLETLLKPLFDLRNAEELAPLARGLAFRLSEALGVLERTEVSEDVRGLDQEMRASLRKLGVRFGAHHIYVPPLLKPHPSGLLALLWAMKNGGLDGPGVAEIPALSAAGRTTVPVDASFPPALYRVVGYRIAGPRAVRLDILERLADIIRPLLAWRPTAENAAPPPGATLRGGFTIIPPMTSLLGTSGEDFAAVLRSLGYRMERREVPAMQPQPGAEAAGQAPETPTANPSPEESASSPSETAEEAAVAPIAAQPSAGDELATGNEPAEIAPVEASVDQPELAAEDEPAATAPVEPSVDQPEPTAADEPVAIAPAEASADQPEPAAADDPAATAPIEVDRPEPSGWGEEPSAVAEPEAPAVSAEINGGEAAPVVASEPVFIEIWRPVRAGGDRRPNRGPRQQGKTNVAAGAEVAEERPQRREGSGRDRPRGPRPDGAGRPRRDRQRPDGGSTPPPDSEARGNRDQRRGRNRDDGAERNSRPPERPAAFKPREKTIDPDSPFAALAALKADLEKRGR